MALCLRGSGYRVMSAASGAEALRLTGERPPDFDLLVTDIVMPGGMNGLQLAARLSGLKPSLKAIAITGHYAGAEPQALPPGMLRLAKPFTVEALLERVRSRLDSA